MDQREIGNLVLQKRREMGLTQEELARRGSSGKPLEHPILPHMRI